MDIFMSMALVSMLGAAVAFFVGYEKGRKAGDESTERWRQIALKIQEKQNERVLEPEEPQRETGYNKSYGQPDVVDYLNSYYGKETR